MLFLTKLHLENFCNYDNYTFDFKQSDGNPYKYICFFGPNGVGKCVVSSCYINTYEKGMIQIGELFNNVDLSPDTWYDANFSVECDGSLHKVNKIYYNGEKSTTKIKTKCGFSLEGSSDRHKILGVNDGEIKFVKINDLKQGDFVCISRKSYFSDNSCISNNLAKVLGYLIAEGHISKSIRFFNTNMEINADFCQNFFNEFGQTLIPKKFPSTKGECHRTDIPAKYNKSLLKAGLKLQKSRDKTVPKSILTSSKEVIISFLQAYFEGDGGIEKDTEAVTCASKSYILMHQIHLLLLRLGIVSVLKVKNTQKLSYVNRSWKIFIQGQEVVKYAQAIGFISIRKKEELDDLLLILTLSHRNPNKDIIPFSLISKWASHTKDSMKENNIRFHRSDYKNTTNGLHCLQPNYLNQVKLGISRNKIQQCIKTVNHKMQEQEGEVLTLLEEPSWFKEDYFFDQVESTEQGNDKLFDICVDDKHCFWSNGFTSHNTTLLEAISLLTMNQMGRDPEYIKRSLQKYVRSKDYNPSYDRISGHVYKNDFAVKTENNTAEMIIEGTYEMDGQTYIVRLTQSGFDRNDLAPNDNGPGPWGDDHLRYRQRVAHMITSDNDLAMSKFQLHKDQIKCFEKVASSVMRYPVVCIPPSGVVPMDEDYCTDFVIHKKDHKIHYKRMSAGEKKISKSFSQLFNLIHDLEFPDPGEPVMKGWPRILLIDNVEMHVYYDRHVTMVKSLKSSFLNQQIFATTHSGVLIQRFINGESDPSELMIDLEKINC